MIRMGPFASMFLFFVQSYLRIKKGPCLMIHSDGDVCSPIGRDMLVYVARVEEKIIHILLRSCRIGMFSLNSHGNKHLVGLAMKTKKHNMSWKGYQEVFITQQRINCNTTYKTGTNEQTYNSFNPFYVYY